MKITPSITFALFALLPHAASAQFSVARPTAPKGSVTAIGAPAGGFLAGVDDCNSAHENIGVGEVFDYFFSTQTTGAEGQMEANCYAFGMTGVDQDVWFDWTAEVSGTKLLETCGGTGIDTKLAVWPGTVGCPLDGTSLVCNDDACGTQSRVTWNATAGELFTFQIGTFPGAAGGLGTFDVRRLDPLPCGTHDDGTSENALGLTAGGETGWMHHDACLYDLHSILTAYGSPGANSPSDGNASRIAIYRDPDCSADATTTPPVLDFSISTTVMNAGTDILNVNPLACPIDYSGTCLWVLATADNAPGEFPAPMDMTVAYDDAWVLGSTTGPGTLDLVDLSNNSVPPTRAASIGFPTAWMLRLVGTDGDSAFGTACTGNCIGTPCPCGNEGAPDEGCVNSLGVGAKIVGLGSASVSNDSFELRVSQVPNQPGIFFQGDNYLPNEPVFGSGIRCCGDNVVRWIVILPGGGCGSSNQPDGCGIQVGGVGGSIAALGGLSAGDSRCYQYWYRDPTSPCPGGPFNLSPGVTAFWGP